MRGNVSDYCILYAEIEAEWSFRAGSRDLCKYLELENYLLITCFINYFIKKVVLHVL